MGIKTNIEYCDSSTNPVPGCTGCELYHLDPARNHCYAATLINRYKGKKGWPLAFTNPIHFPDRLPQAIRWPDLTGTERPNKPWLDGLPRIIFVNDLGDLFCHDAPSPWSTLAPHLEAMAESPHVYLVLTKWPKQMVDFLYGYYALNDGEEIPHNILWGTSVTAPQTFYRINQLLGRALDGDPHVLRGMRRWLSLEPLLGEIDLGLRNWAHVDGMGIDWVAAGGESGSNARPFLADWARLVRDDCQGAGVPFFLKQLGSDVGRSLKNKKGADPDEWQPDLRVRQVFSDGKIGGSHETG